MQTIAEQIYPDEFTQLTSIIGHVENGRDTDAADQLERLERRLPDIQSPEQKLQVELFVQALRNRLRHGQAENLYLVPDQGQQIQMFNFMAQKFPVVRYAQDIANSIYLGTMRGHESCTILDIGIGTGQQMANLLEQALAGSASLKSVTILGIEPSEESLQKAEARFVELSAKQHVSVRFHGVCKTVEQLTDADWGMIENAAREAGDSPFMINASFALHHVQPVSFRPTLFARLKSYNPAAFVIIEPYADYTVDSVSTRFRNAWHHYGLTFQAIDTIDAQVPEKSAVKQVFFGREMVDVLSEGERVEQFETAESWSAKLAEAGFRLLPVKNIHAADFNPLIRIEETGGYLGFNIRNHPIVAVISAN